MWHTKIQTFGCSGTPHSDLAWVLVRKHFPKSYIILFVKWPFPPHLFTWSLHTDLAFGKGRRFQTFSYLLPNPSLSFPTITSYWPCKGLGDSGGPIAFRVETSGGTDTLVHVQGCKMVMIVLVTPGQRAITYSICGSFFCLWKAKESRQ